ncbi:MAG: hypothetical protein CFK49_06945 [Armatimonadetes bacterium JP3_11]|nr:MAG: hypothetical protein CFK49_06945 [Armatimonadetes bacterium JP3_11]RMH10815.1 MAG: sigma-70 family RNA polymerase sigma factor [Armatimonadota bacterium]
MGDWEQERIRLLNELRLLQRDLDACLEAFLDTLPPLINLILAERNISPRSPLGEDLAQTARLAVLKKWRDYDPAKGSLSTYLTQVMRSAILHHLRAMGYITRDGKRRYQVPLLERDIPVVETIDYEYLSVKDALTPDEWDLLALFYIEYAHLPEDQRYEKIRLRYIPKRKADEVRVAVADAVRKLERATGISQQHEEAQVHPHEPETR